MAKTKKRKPEHLGDQLRRAAGTFSSDGPSARGAIRFLGAAATLALMLLVVLNVTGTAAMPAEWIAWMVTLIASVVVFEAAKHTKPAHLQWRSEDGVATAELVER